MEEGVQESQQLREEGQKAEHSNCNIEQSIASNKSRNASLPLANRPQLPISSSLKCSAFDESSKRRHLKCPVVLWSQFRDDIEDQDAIFRPWQKSSWVLPLKDQVETKKLKNKAIEFVCEELRFLRSSIAMAPEKGNLRNYSKDQLYDQITKNVLNLGWLDSRNRINSNFDWFGLRSKPHQTRPFTCRGD
ncbi:hypothetical protein Cgig2_010071 [Carnegiea gigantea]|uniref:Uncharacterized protein n=1 Tax=Carnegiea gigantea TaxID=171969 RepID=A0A9Q1JU74_9CARY|nr:hypothetical protein Cgig2_010071 [Carnegiea gigantea]